jgi:hypothetical protein
MEIKYRGYKKGLLVTSGYRLPGLLSHRPPPGESGPRQRHEHAQSRAHPRIGERSAAELRARAIAVFGDRSGCHGTPAWVLTRPQTNEGRAERLVCPSHKKIDFMVRFVDI